MDVNDEFFSTLAGRTWEYYLLSWVGRRRGRRVCSIEMEEEEVRGGTDCNVPSYSLALSLSLSVSHPTQLTMTGISGVTWGLFLPRKT